MKKQDINIEAVEDVQTKYRKTARGKGTKKSREKGTGSVIKNRGKYYLRTKINGKVLTQLIRNEQGEAVTKFDEATQIANGLKSVLSIKNREQLVAEVAIARRLKSQATLPLRDIWTAYLEVPNRPDSGANTLKGYQVILSYFLKWIGKAYPEVAQAGQVNPEMAQNYFADLNASGVSGRTFNSYRQCLTMIFKYIQKRAGLSENPFAEIPRRNLETINRKEFSQEQVEQIFRCFDEGFWYDCEMIFKKKKTVCRREYVPLHKEQMRVLLALACWTGCRGEDAAMMTWGCVDFKNNTISYAPNKTFRRTNKKIPPLPIHPTLRSFLEEANRLSNMNNNPDAYILPDVAKRFLKNPTGIRKDVQKMIHIATGLEVTNDGVKARRKLAASVYSLHSFRHTFVSFCANNGVPLAVVAEIVGHGNPSMTKNYTHISMQARKEAIASLPTVQSAHPTEDREADEKVKILDALTKMPLESLKKMLDQCE